jgi:DNA repair exonuclease SbcCD nuclease subunit
MSKQLIFTDIHWGINQDNSKKIKLCSNSIDFIINTAEETKADTIIFMGDWFNSRSSICVNTFFRSYDALKKLSKRVKKIYLIVGNHDAHYKTSIDVHSLKSFENINNVFVIDKKTEIKQDGKSFLLYPWAEEIDIANESYDAMFGHFDFSGAMVTSSYEHKVGKYSIAQLTGVSPLVFSGHFHIRKEYTSKTGKIVTVGCPHEINWNDVGNKKGCYVLDTKDLSYKFIENKEAPMHYKLFWSDILEKKKIPAEKIKNNYVKLIIDEKYDYNTIIKLTNKLWTIEPFSLETDYLFANELNSVHSDMSDAKMYSNEEYILDYIKELEVPDYIDKEKIKKMSMSYYEAIKNREEIDE